MKFNEINQRGISEVIATLGIVLLTFAAIAVIAGFIVPFVRESLNESSECINYKDYFYFKSDFGYNCLNFSANEYIMSVGAKSADDETSSKVSGFKFVFLENEESEVVNVIDGEIGGGMKMLNGSDVLYVPKRGETKTFVYTNEKSFYKVEVAPVLVSGRVCEKSDGVELSRCE